MSNNKAVNFRLPMQSLEKLDTLARWHLESRTSVIIRALNIVYAMDARERGVEPYPEVDRTVQHPSYGESDE